MREAERLCDRIGIIHHGRLLSEGTIHELRERFGQPELEEIFFDLIHNYDQQLAAV
jgi:ABC-type Na+ transport system ATPase subunit NatA